MKRWIILATVTALAAALPQIFIENNSTAATTAIAGVCLVLWLSEMAPPFVPTLLLWTLVPAILGRGDAAYSLGHVLAWAADPVLALFFGGFVLGVATERQGVDRLLARWALARSKGSFGRLLFAGIFLTAFLSMWISNIAAAALMFACMRPAFSLLEADDPARRMLLVGIAFGANLGGIATPIGTGPNAIAIAAVESVHRVTFVEWMTFALPLSLGMLLMGFLLLRLKAGRIGEDRRQVVAGIAESLTENGSETREPSARGRLLIIMVATAILWLTEPLHGVPAAVVALAAAALLFLTRTLKKEDIARIDWSTLILIAGGITLGRLLEASGVVAAAAAGIAFEKLPTMIVLVILCLASAALSALMSNTATAVLLIPIAMALVPQPSTAVLVAVAASFGMPFVISTPPNAMAYGEGGLRTTDLLVPGLVIMIAGCILVGLTGAGILNMAGIP